MHFALLSDRKDLIKDQKDLRNSLLLMSCKYAIVLFVCHYE